MSWWLPLARERRSRMEIVIDILTEALSDVNKTRIMYRANLNFLRFERYFSDLLDKGLIIKANSPRGKELYRTTEKGRRFLKIMQDAEEIFSP